MEFIFAVALFLTFVAVALFLALVVFPWVMGVYEGWASHNDDSKLDDWIEGLMDRMYDIGRKQGEG